jgi:DnaJ family protein C protein 7
VQNEVKNGNKDMARQILEETLKTDETNKSILPMIRSNYSLMKVETFENCTTLEKEPMERIFDDFEKYQEDVDLIKFVENEFSIDTSKAQKINEQGGVEYLAGNFERACDLFTHALKMNPDNKIYLVNRSACYIKLEKFENAFNDALKVISVDETYWKGYSRAMQVCLISGDINQADTFLWKLEQNVRDSSALTFNEKRMLLKIKPMIWKIDKFYNENNFGECLVWLTLAMKIATNCEAFENQKAECLIMLGKFDEADAIVSNALNKNPENLHMVFNRGLIFYYGGDVSRSIGRFEKVLCRNLDFPRAKTFKDLAQHMAKLRNDGRT